MGPAGAGDDPVDDDLAFADLTGEHSVGHHVTLAVGPGPLAHHHDVPGVQARLHDGAGDDDVAGAPTQAGRCDVREPRQAGSDRRD